MRWCPWQGPDCGQCPWKTGSWEVGSPGMTETVRILYCQIISPAWLILDINSQSIYQDIGDMRSAVREWAVAIYHSWGHVYVPYQQSVCTFTNSIYTANIGIKLGWIICLCLLHDAVHASASNVHLVLCAGDVGGYTVHYSNLTFVSVRGAGHMVPYTQPERAFDLFKWAITRSQDKHTTQRSLRVD